MDWYYANGSERVGPIDDEAFRALVADGVIAPETLVWNADLENWVAWGKLNTPPPIPQAAPGGTLESCSQCGRAADSADGVVFRNQFICANCKPNFFLHLQQGLPIPNDLRYAGFWPRFAAKFLDGFLVGIPLWILMGVLWAALDFKFQGFQDVFNGIYLLFMLAYNTHMIGTNGTTYGKRAMKLRVVAADGTAPTMKQAFGRALGEILSSVICDIGYLMVAFDEESRGLHDRLAKTRVVYADPARP